jgi:hypothetical protein
MVEALAANGFALDAYGEGRFSSSWWQAVRSDRRPRPLDLAMAAVFVVYDLIPVRKDVMVVRATPVDTPLPGPSPSPVRSPLPGPPPLEAPIP